MHELACPACNQASQYDLRDYMYMCPACSVTFKLDMESGQKDLFGDHYIVHNTMDALAVKTLAIEWLKSLHHKPERVDREFFVVDIKGFSLPFWVVSLECHTVWKGLVQRQRHRHALDQSAGSDYLTEQGQFRRSYRWAVSARNNICEHFGLTRLHEPREELDVEWDGFPLDSTFSRGRLSDDDHAKSAYDVREYFDFKYANALPIIGVQVNEEEALRRTKNHIEMYHYRLAQLNVDYLVDFRSELEIAGIQLIHLPFWFARYVYRPANALRHFYRKREKHIVVDGYGKGVLQGELAIMHRDKVWVNAIITGMAAILFFVLGLIWHPAFYVVSLFAAAVAGASAYLSSVRAAEAQAKEAAAASAKPAAARVVANKIA